MRLKVSDLRVGTEYAIQVRATAGEDVSEWSPRFKFVTIRDETQPKVPQNVTWVTSGDSYMAEWDSVTEDIKGRPISILRYNVRLRSGQMEEILPASAAAETPSGRQRWDLLKQKAVNMFGAAGAREIEFSVRAVVEGPDGPIKSDWSTPITVGHEAPGAPTNGAAKGIIDGIVLTWEPSPTSGILGYRVYVGDNPDFVPTNANMASNDPNWTWEPGVDENYIQGLEYTYYTSTYADHYFKVRAVSAYNIESADLLIIGAPINPFIWDNVAPDVPTALAGTMSTTDPVGVNLTWSSTGEEDLAGFWIRYRKPSDPINTYRDMRRAEPNERSLFIPIAQPFAAYDFEIQAYDETSNASAWSAPVTISGGDGTPPPQVGTVTLSAGLDTLYVSWPASTADDVKDGAGVYEVEYSTSATFASGNVSTTTGATEIVFAGLASGTTYYVRVRAVDAEDQNGAWSATVNASTTDFPNPPGATDGVVPAKVGAVTTLPALAAINVSWPEVTTDANANPQPAEAPIVYEVHASTTTGFTPSSATHVTDAGGTSAVVSTVEGSNVTFGTTYYIKVIAKDADGLGVPSDQVSGTSRQVTSGEVESITAGKITTGSLASATITMAAGGIIKSNNYVAGTSGYQLDESGLIVYDGTVSASALKAGTISGTTINIGAGGVLNVDSTAVIKSNNYSAGSTGWQLSSSGLEVNGAAGAISASSIKAGTFNAGAIYVGSGGGIYDANGYWSITPSSINISNGSINAAAITSGVLRSNAYAVNADGSTNFSYWAWQIDKDGTAVLGNTYIRGRLLVDSGVIQSSYYYPGSSGWRIDSSGSVYFNQAEVNAGTFKTQASGSRLELGYSGGYYVDQIRMFNGYSVSSLRNPDNRTGTVYMSFGENQGGQMTFGTAADANVYIQGYLSTPRLKFTSGFIQARTSSDGGYGEFSAAAYNVNSVLRDKTGVTKEKVDTKAILKANGLHKWRTKPEKGRAPSEIEYNKIHQRDKYGLIADYMPDWMRMEDGYSVTAAVGFLWEALREANDRIEVLENKLGPKA